MTAPIALQLYTVRDALAHDFEGVIRRIAAIGYKGVETAKLPGTTAAAAKKLFDELGLAVTSAHLPLPLGDQQNEVLETAEALGCRRIVCAYLPPEQYQSKEQTKRACALLNEANEVAKANNFEFGVHNHWWEFQPVGDSYPYELWLQLLDPDIFFEIDVYWVQTAGLNPTLIVEQFGERAPLLHIKDGPANQDEAMTAVGEGQLDFRSILEAAGSHPDWLIVELDRCDTDMLTAVEKSYGYLTSARLASGNV